MARLVQRLGLTRFEADEYYKQALAAYNNRKLDEAILAMEQAIEMLPNHAEYYAARGFFYLEDGIKDKAAADFERALKVYAYEPLAHYGRGVIAYNAKNWDEALAHFTDAYRSAPERGEFLYYLALAHHRKRQNKEALFYMNLAQEKLEAKNDKRRADAGRWVKQLEKLIKSTKDDDRA